ncbi:hypothetical protein ACFCV6_18040 [Streptomyces virginiae]|uniref:hypothetical protein n=1 Tax=Streptomyces virginiae TaxID=1961 RepID=UPI0035D65834
MAFLRGQQVRGTAMVKVWRLAFARLRETEDPLSRADDRNDAFGGYDRAASESNVSGPPAPPPARQPGWWGTMVVNQQTETQG